ncbi:ribonuclease T2 family protein [Alsobacter metallidurans]|uniref:ribonuclease T2 family protein n=1 Tax=Alsobacter metallidurans TaxID=340221 RepID=UPI00166EDF8F|nr:ribonuclease T2 [Alsobacter metallidurans]
MGSSRARSLRGLIGAALAVLAIGFASAASAQQGERRGASAGDFDFYVLALSWSPGFCSAGGGDDKARDQCQSGSNLGFVVHGLWPQYERGFPSECSPAGRNPSRIALEATKGVFPDEGLARYEWRKHGTCSGLSPTDYFAAVKAARDRLVVPPGLKEPKADQTWTSIDLERAFVASNPGLRTDMMSVDCKRETLQEIRVCFSKDLRDFVACPEVNRRGCRVREIKVPAVR